MVKNFNFVGNYEDWLKFAEKIAKEDFTGATWSISPNCVPLSPSKGSSYTIILRRIKPVPPPCDLCGLVRPKEYEEADVNIRFTNEAYHSLYWKKICHVQEQY